MTAAVVEGRGGFCVERSWEGGKISLVSGSVLLAAGAQTMNYTAYPVHDDRPTRWYDLKGAWVIYVLLIAVLRILLGEFLEAGAAWTVTSLIHAGVRFFFLFFFFFFFL